MLMYYDNFIAEIKYISRTGCFYGEIINHDSVIVFQAEHKNCLAEVFKIAVDQYLTYCQENPAPINLNAEAYYLEQEALI